LSDQVSSSKTEFFQILFFIVNINRGGLAPQILVGFKKKKKKIAAKTKLLPPKQEISTNQADLKKKKGHDAEGPPIALGAPKLEGPRGIFPTSLYGQSAPEYKDEVNFGFKPN
jgi:hypothetical protein